MPSQGIIIFKSLFLVSKSDRLCLDIPLMCTSSSVLHLWLRKLIVIIMEYHSLNIPRSYAIDLDLIVSPGVNNVFGERIFVLAVVAAWNLLQIKAISCYSSFNNSLI